MCKLCGQIKKDEKEILNHIEEVHVVPDSQWYPCDECPTVMCSGPRLSRHQLQCHQFKDNGNGMKN